ncbi:YigZ family protein [Aquibacillus sp. 3ASR75-11]|uniref:YigZ family protein n=1 Tax=Terrihalobacillus insolitus TaxID=2950438 RepID=A0A9X3WTE8_9BACI|nr:YigZ family protein [Terrihalobacillus insolitus]MDC3412217.1 YigZ family protein [Terrihalobacillus insolitus]MDC3423089.1 YigZ family protein [Terrihalobacillus insolitus]
MLNSYLTVKRDGSDEITIQKSRFIGYVRRVETEAEAQAFIQEIKRKHRDATHNCSAYMIGEHDQIQKANDDGEPNGTAGVPILEVLKMKKLKDTAVVVTRYFGGIKLGAGGLIRAYSSTTSHAISAAGIVKRQLMQEMNVTVGYSLLGKLENEIRNTDYLLDRIDYLEKVSLTIYVESGTEDTFQSWIINLTSDHAEIKIGDVRYMEQD